MFGAFARTTRRALARTAAAVGDVVTIADVIFMAGLASLCLGVHQVYAPAAPIVAGLALMWAAHQPATPQDKGTH